MTEKREDIARVEKQLQDYVTTNFPNSEPKTKPLRIGPGRDAKIEARISGPDPVGSAPALGKSTGHYAR